MAMTIVDVLSTVVLPETHFVVTYAPDGKFLYDGVLSYCLISKVKSSKDGSMSIMSIPFVDGGCGLAINRLLESDKCVFHWSEFRNAMKDTIFFDEEERNGVKNLLIKLWGES